MGLQIQVHDDKQKQSLLHYSEVLIKAVVESVEVSAEIEAVVDAEVVHQLKTQKHAAAKFDFSKSQ